MVSNVKILLDPKFYYQKLKELAAKSTQVFSHVGNNVKKVFFAVFLVFICFSLQPSF